MATQWSIVLRARDGNFKESQEALQILCDTYDAPVFSYIRNREGLSRAECEDLAQEFFANFIQKEWLKHLTYEKSFRNFLLRLLTRFLKDARVRRKAQKRGGDCDFVPLTTPDGPEWAMVTGGIGLSPDEAYDRKWAETVLHEASRKLKLYYERLNKLPLYEAIKDLVPGEHGEKSYAAIGAQLGVTEQAVKNAVGIFRARQWDYLLAQVAPTVDDAAEAELELRYLMGLLGKQASAKV